uniref:TfoX/Sxy family protein n=1 Tax=Prevotella sp. GTC17254 TaxID=3236794 RepID=A0AB33IWE0_9BACT
MACTLDFIDFVCMQIAPVGDIRARKMFGDYIIYANDKPVIIACDNVAYIKILPEIEHLMHDAERGFPYEGAKEHYILDVGNTNHAVAVVSILEKCLPFPKSKKKKKQ